MNRSSRAVVAPGNDRPILDAAKRTSFIAVAGSVVSAALAFGLISPKSAGELDTGVAYLLGAAVTVLPVLTSALHALGIVRGAEPRTTPVDSPSDAAGVPLVPLDIIGYDDPDSLAADDEDLAAQAQPVAQPASRPNPPLTDGPSSVDGLIPGGRT